MINFAIGHKREANELTEQSEQNWMRSNVKVMRRVVAVVVLASLCFWLGFLTQAQTSTPSQKELEPGLEPYTPTKMEWFTLECQAVLSNSYSLERDGYVVGVSRLDARTIAITVLYRATTDRRSMNQSVQTARMIIKTIAKRHGWEDWIRIREELNQLER